MLEAELVLVWPFPLLAPAVLFGVAGFLFVPRVTPVLTLPELPDLELPLLPVIGFIVAVPSPTTPDLPLIAGFPPELLEPAAGPP